MQLLVSEHPGYWKLASNCLASFRSVASPFSFSSHDVSTIRFNPSPSVLASLYEIRLSWYNEREPRNCSDVTEIFFFPTKYENRYSVVSKFLLVLSKRSWGWWSNNHFRSFLEERRFLFSNLEKTLENCSDYLSVNLTREYLLQEDSNARCQISENCPPPSKWLFIESSRLSKFYFHENSVIRSDPRRKIRWNFQRYLAIACDGRGSILSAASLYPETEDYWSKFEHEETSFQGGVLRLIARVDAREKSERANEARDKIKLEQCLPRHSLFIESFPRTLYPRRRLRESLKLYQRNYLLTGYGW